VSSSPPHYTRPQAVINLIAVVPRITCEDYVSFIHAMHVCPCFINERDLVPPSMHAHHLCSNYTRVFSIELSHMCESITISLHSSSNKRLYQSYRSSLGSLVWGRFYLCHATLFLLQL
jgi:hypothetical protein